MCTSLFCAFIQVVIVILASGDTMRCYGKDDHESEVKNTVSEVTGTAESGAKETA
jgi:hypothetical protein